MSLALISFLLLRGERSYGKPSVTCVIKSRQIAESSGIAPSRAFPGQYYTHNDSGDTARFFRFRLDGKVEAEYSLTGVGATDWEDMATVQIGKKRYVYLADIGDNTANRQNVVVYRTEEPTGRSGPIARYDRFIFTYPDGAHDAEALLVDPASGDITIVTKTGGAKATAYLASDPKPDKPMVLKSLGKVDFGSSDVATWLVTGGSVSPDGKRVVLRTYFAAYEFDVAGKFNSWLASKARRVKIAAEKQGESICYSLSGNEFLTTSEGQPCTVNRIPILQN